MNTNKILDNTSTVKLIIEKSILGVVKRRLQDDVDLYSIAELYEKIKLNPEFLHPNDVDDKPKPIEINASIKEEYQLTYTFKDGIFIDNAALLLFKDGLFNTLTSTDSVWVKNFNSLYMENDNMTYCYAPTEMMTEDPLAYVISDEDPSVGGDQYYRVIHNEPTIYHIIAQHYKFKFDEISQEYVEITDLIAIRKNLLRGIKRKIIETEVGNLSARVADYDKLLCFLIKRFEHQFNPDELEVLSAFINKPINLEHIRQINEREKKINEILSSFGFNQQLPKM